MKISLFNGTRPEKVKDITIDEALERVRNGASLNLVTKIRETADYKAVQDLKRNLYAVTFAGQFTYRSNNGLSQASGLLTLDIDKVQNPGFIKQYLFDNYDHCFAAWLSPSGNGVKALFKIPVVKSDTEYKEYYNSILQHIDIADPDPANKDISRLCFESFDPDLLSRDFDKTSTWTDRITAPVHRADQISITDKSAVDLDELFSRVDRMIQAAPDGSKHYTLLKASRLMGGYVASEAITEQLATDFLEDAISKRSIDSFDGAKRTIRDGIKFGIQAPIHIDLTKDYYSHPKVETFPVEVFPQLYQDMIRKLQAALNFPPDFTAFSLLWLWASIMGKRFVVEVKPGYRTYPVLWFAIIGDPGTVKSHPINTVKAPLDAINSENYKQYKEDLKQWLKIEDNRDPRPKWKKYTINDFTIESLEKVLDANVNGVGLYTDELAAWIDNSNKYASGQSNTLSKWLSLYDSGLVMIDRKTQEPALIEKACIPIIGTSQPQTIISYFKNMSGNGFFDRFLFAFPEVKMQCLPPNSSPITELNQHESIIRAFVKESPRLADDMVFTLESFKSYQVINQWLVDIADDERTNERLRNYIPKLISAIPRLAIIIETINSVVTNESTPAYVTTKSMEKTFDVIRYLFNQADRVLIDFNKLDDMNAVITSTRYLTKQAQCYALKTAGFKIPDIAKRLNISPYTVKGAIIREQKRLKENENAKK